MHKRLWFIILGQTKSNTVSVHDIVQYKAVAGPGQISESKVRKARRHTRSSLTPASRVQRIPLHVGNCLLPFQKQNFVQSPNPNQILILHIKKKTMVKFLAQILWNSLQKRSHTWIVFFNSFSWFTKFHVHLLMIVWALGRCVEIKGCADWICEKTELEV